MRTEQGLSFHLAWGSVLWGWALAEQGQGETGLEQARAGLTANRALGGMWQQQDKTSEARDLLAPVYDWFTEGFDTTDLKDAKVLLKKLA